jgi:hypothetical protein
MDYPYANPFFKKTARRKSQKPFIVAGHYIIIRICDRHANTF